MITKNFGNAFIAGVVTGIGLLIWVWWPKTFETKKIKPIVQQRPDPSPSVPPHPNTTIVLPTDTATKKEEAKTTKEDRIRSAFLTPISVYGKVTDEEGKPVPEASVEIGIADKPLQASSKRIETTRSDGTFSLMSHGIAFSLRAFKDGFYTIDKSTAHRNVVVPAEGDIPQPTAESPIVLILRRHGETEPLIFKATGQVNVPETGQSVDIELTGREVGRHSLTIISTIGDSLREPYDWTYELGVRGGGIIERRDQFDFEAPSQGYQNTAVVDMRANAHKWANGAERDYFVRFEDGLYGRCSIRFYPRKRNFVVVESFVNPIQGHRNLEFDPHKEIKFQ